LRRQVAEVRCRGVLAGSGLLHARSPRDGQHGVRLADAVSVRELVIGRWRRLGGDDGLGRPVAIPLVQELGGAGSAFPAVGAVRDHS
ncbi:MAG TPA: hypothetical protein VMV07_12425, partial [Streptosporangiaceae bacterium]|nr:hypothetical protein [Streptosporangiaceae bacterium]